MANVLVIAPHADDEILGCGGTISKHIEQGDSVYVAVMTNASIGAPELFNEEQIKETREEAKRSHKYLGIKETFFFDFPAPQLEQYPQYKIANAQCEQNTVNSYPNSFSWENTSLGIAEIGYLHKDERGCETEIRLANLTLIEDNVLNDDFHFGVDNVLGH